jgi:ABC-type multidrug transport system fused ATPase/permease subunit
VLRDISLTIKAGQKAAIVGPNGSGKSSIFKIIAGLYEPNEGSVAVPAGETAGTGIASVEQDTFLFSGSFSGNISLGSPHVPDDPEGKRVLIDAAKKAMIHDFIESTEKGYISDYGAQGARLSGGQRQRLSIARVLYRNPEVILLDEPASALDRETADDIMAAVKTAFSGKTIIMITHSISLIQDFDVIFLLDNGRIADSGSHEHLLRNTLYSRLVQEGRDEKVIS